MDINGDTVVWIYCLTVGPILLAYIMYLLARR